MFSYHGSFCGRFWCFLTLSFLDQPSFICFCFKATKLLLSSTGSFLPSHISVWSVECFCLVCGTPDDTDCPSVLQVAKCLQDRRRQRRHRLSSSSLKKIPTEKFRRGETPYETCAICLEDYQDGEKLRLLPCSHGKSEMTMCKLTSVREGRSTAR